jgi:hypothetical protein
LSALNYTTEELKVAVAEIRHGNFDLVRVKSCHMVECVRSDCSRRSGAVPHRPLYDWQNIESEAMYRYAATVNSLPRRKFISNTS